MIRRESTLESLSEFALTTDNGSARQAVWTFLRGECSHYPSSEACRVCGHGIHAPEASIQRSAEDTRLSTAVAPLVAMYMKSMEEHELVTVPITDSQSFAYLRAKDTRIFSSLIVFTSEGIGITGDFRPGTGVWGAFGYGRKWFEEHHYPDYLASKFLRRGFNPRLAVAWLKRVARNVALDVDADLHFTLYDFEKLCVEHHIDPADSDGETWGYDDVEVAALVAIHRKYNELRLEN